MRINVPNGESLKQVNFDNPLYTFRFPKEALENKFGSFDKENRQRTYRCPSPNSYPNSANRNLDGRPYKQWIVSSSTYRSLRIAN